MKRSFCEWVIWGVALIMATALQCSAAIEYVSAASTNPAPPYATPATAANHIQDAVNVATNGDTVLVEPGTYTLTNQVMITRGITLRGADGAGQTFLNVSFGDYGLWVSNSTAVVDGFSMNRTRSDAGGIFMVGATILNCNFTNFTHWPTGASVSMTGGTLSNAIVTYLKTGYFSGPGVSCSGGGLVTGCQILGSGSGGPEVSGTGILLVDSQLRNSLLSGGRNGEGPAVNAVGSTITGCTIAQNANLDVGGGACLDSCLMDRCIVNGNRSTIACQGGGIFETNSIIRDSLIVDNSEGGGAPDTPPGTGGGVYMRGGALVNCTVSGNTVSDACNITNGAPIPGQGAGVYLESGGITNCIIFGNGPANSGEEWHNTGPGVFDFTCTTPDPGGRGNIVQDPQFVSSTNYHLAASSPCIGTGMVQSWMTGATDLDGQPRMANGEVDMGCYENQSQDGFQPVAVDDPRCVGQGAGNGFAFSFPTQPDRTYFIQYTFSLAPADWQTVAMVSGDGIMMSYTNQATACPSCFYRVMAQ